MNTKLLSHLALYQFMTATWIRFDKAMKAQGLDRATFLPCRGRFQPYAAWYGLVMSTIVLVISAYPLFYPGQFDGQQFVFACESHTSNISIGQH